MISNLASNALYRKYEEEKRLLELYGHVSSLTYEEWLETKKTNKTMESTIKWQTGEPKENGTYLVTYRFGHYTIENTMEKIYDISIGTSYWVSFWHNYDDEHSDCRVIAWCKLSDIEPYKEEKK